MLLAFDGGALLYRVVYAHTKHGLATRSGAGTGALFFLVKSLRSYIMNLRPSKVIMVQDAGYSARRRALYPAYKSGRGTRVTADTDEARQEILRDIRRQRVWAEKMLPSLGVRSIKMKGREADDILAQMAIQVEAAGEQMVIVSDDKDMLQLVGPHVTVYRPIADETVDSSNFAQYTGCPDARRWLVWKCIVGDGSDRVPGVNGCGGKTALEAINAGIDSFAVDVLLSAEQHSNWRVRRIAEQIDTVLFNQDLLDLYAEEFSSEQIEAIRAAWQDGVARCQVGEVARWFEQFEFSSLMHDLAGWLVPFNGLV